MDADEPGSEADGRRSEEMLELSLTNMEDGGEQQDQSGAGEEHYESGAVTPSARNLSLSQTARHASLGTISYGFHIFSI